MKPHVTIIGGGASGTLACMRILERFDGHVRIDMIERRSRQFNRGVAYSARLSQQLLNVPAGRMNLRGDLPDDFLHWTQQGPVPGATADDFLARTLFGDYLHDRYHALLDRHRGSVRELHAVAVAIDEHPAHGLRVRLDDGHVIPTDHVVLALGNAPPAHVPGLSDQARQHEGYIAWPWKPGVLERIHPEDPVLFVGSGLTTTDIVLSLRDAGHRGKITVLSRNGRLPLPHATPAAHKLSTDPPAPGDVLAVLRWLRNEARLAADAHVPWQQVMDLAKPHAQRIWQGFDRDERARFLRHARPFWEVHRHRMPKQVHARMQSMIADGRMEVIAARIEEVTGEGSGLLVRFRDKKLGSTVERRLRHVVNCTGPQSDTRRMDQPLLYDLLHKGLGEWDALHFGLHCNSDGSLVDATGRTSARISAIGPLCKAALWECTAVPEIREQAAKLAERIHGQIWPAKQRRNWRARIQRFTDHLALSDA